MTAVAAQQGRSELFLAQVDGAQKGVGVDIGIDSRLARRGRRGAPSGEVRLRQPAGAEHFVHERSEFFFEPKLHCRFHVARLPRRYPATAPAPGDVETDSAEQSTPQFAKS